MLLNLGLKASGFLEMICSFDFKIKFSCNGVLQQGEQSHFEVHFRLLLKHSQYNFRHFDFLQLHGLNSDSSEVASFLELSFSETESSL